MLKKIAIVLAGTLIATFTVTGCGGKSETSIEAYIFLYDISVSPEMTSYSPLDRRDQLLSQLSNSFAARRALYFDFVRRDAGRQQVTSLISPSLYVEVDGVIDEVIVDGTLKKETKDKINDVWLSLATNQALADSDLCASDLRNDVFIAGGGFFSNSQSTRMASKFCSTVRQALHVINEIPVTAETSKQNGIGSGIQNAINTAVDKMESEEMRLQRRNPEIKILPTIVLTSDFNEVHNNLRFVLVHELEKIEKPDGAIDLAMTDIGGLEKTNLGFILESDGFGTVKGGSVDGLMRDKFHSYWETWLEERGFADYNIGDRGLDWSTL